MGIKQLSTWISKTHPSVVQTFPERWASPGIQGSRVAIDATLLTNRFHFAVNDGALKGKGSLIGWYNLINEMRAHDVKPIAVWDRPGTRAWKFGENKRRWVLRGLNYARKTHEEKREERLVSLRDALEMMERLEPEEQGAVRDHLVRLGTMKTLAGDVAQAASTISSKDGPAKGEGWKSAPARSTIPPSIDTAGDAESVSSHTAAATPSPGATAAPDELDSLERIANMVDTLTEHVTSYRESLQTPEISLFPTQTVLEEALERVKELEDLYESLDEEDVRMRPAPKTGVSPSTTSAPVTSQTSLTSPGSSAGVVEVDFASEVEAETSSAEAMHEAQRLERERERDQEWLAEKMSEIMPPSLFSETRRQAAMSIEEGRILEASLGVCMSLPSPSPSPSPSAPTPPPTAVITSAKAKVPNARTTAHSQPDDLNPLSGIDPLRRLDDLIEAVPGTKAIYERALGQPSKHTYIDCQDLLHRMGVPVVLADAPYEAEGLATALTKAGLADWVASEDSDVIPLGGPQLRHISSARQPLSTIHTPSLLSALSFTPAQLIEFCILLGNDAVPRIRKVGPIKAFKLITAHGTIEAALSAEPAIRKVAEEEIPGYLEMVKTARAVFGQLPEITEEMKVQIEQSEALMSQGGQSGEGAGAGMDHVERWLEEKHGVAFVDPAMPSRLEEYEDLDLP